MLLSTTWAWCQCWPRPGSSWSNWRTQVRPRLECDRTEWPLTRHSPARYLVSSCHLVARRFEQFARCEWWCPWSSRPDRLRVDRRRTMSERWQRRSDTARGRCGHAAADNATSRASRAWWDGCWWPERGRARLCCTIDRLGSRDGRWSAACAQSAAARWSASRPRRHCLQINNVNNNGKCSFDWFVRSDQLTSPLTNAWLSQITNLLTHSLTRTESSSIYSLCLYQLN